MADNCRHKMMLVLPAFCQLSQVIEEVFSLSGLPAIEPLIMRDAEDPVGE
jgi:hypothetical protein